MSIFTYPESPSWMRNWGPRLRLVSVLFYGDLFVSLYQGHPDWSDGNERVLASHVTIIHTTRLINLLHFGL